MENVDDFFDQHFDKANSFLNRLADENKSQEFAEECVRILNDRSALGYIINAISFRQRNLSNPMIDTEYRGLYEDIHMALCVQYSMYKEQGELNQFSPEFLKLFSEKNNQDIFNGILLKNMITQMIAAYIHYNSLLEKYPNVISKI
jgi:hypothetical protein